MLRDELERLGQKRLAALLEEHGGTYTSTEVDCLLGRAHKETGRSLLSLRLDDEERFPKWQFCNNEPLSGLAPILAILSGKSDIAKIRFFLTPSDDLGKITPLEVLQKGGAISPLLERIARQFMSQGAR